MGWYKNGTIAVSGVTVTGTGTNWTDNKQGIGPGQALLIPAAGTVKMYEILRVDSATKLTLTSSAGTVAAGQAYAIMSFYTDSIPDFARRLSAQLSYYQSQMDGWQQIMTGTGSITITAPDGTNVTISSFKKLTDDVAAKLDKNQNLNDLPNKATARTNLDLGSAATENTGTSGNAVAKLNATNTWSASQTIYSVCNVYGTGTGYAHFWARDEDKSTSRGVIYFAHSDTGRINLRPDQGASLGYTYSFDFGGTFQTKTVTQTSDADKKEKITTIDNALDKINKIDGVTFLWKENEMPSAGIIAQQLLEVLPDCVGAVFDDPGEYDNEGNVIREPDLSKRSYSVEYSGVIALCVQAIKELNEKVVELSNR